MRCFNSQPPEGGCGSTMPLPSTCSRFQLTAARRRLHKSITTLSTTAMFQLTAARRRLRVSCVCDESEVLVSTHSRPKAAAPVTHLDYEQAEFQLTAARRRLLPFPDARLAHRRFQLTAARRRLLIRVYMKDDHGCFNSQPPEGGCHVIGLAYHYHLRVSTHSRPKAAAHMVCRKS